MKPRVRASSTTSGRCILALLVGCGRANFDPRPIDARAPSQDTAARSYRGAVLADSPISYWRLDDTDLIARDELGAHAGSYDPACSHTTGALTGDPDLATALDGVSCAVDFGAEFAFPGVAPFTVELWAYPTRTVGIEALFMRETRTVTGPIDGYALVKSSAGVYVERAAAGSNRVTLRSPLALATWHHVVGSYDGATLSFYFDGVLVDAIADPRPLPAVYTTDAHLGVNELQTDYVVGRSDELAIYDHALTPAQIATHYTIGVSGP